MEVGALLQCMRRLRSPLVRCGEHLLPLSAKGAGNFLVPCLCRVKLVPAGKRMGGGGGACGRRATREESDTIRTTNELHHLCLSYYCS